MSNARKSSRETKRPVFFQFPDKKEVSFEEASGTSTDDEQSEAEEEETSAAAKKRKLPIEFQGPRKTQRAKQVAKPSGRSTAKE